MKGAGWTKPGQATKVIPTGSGLNRRQASLSEERQSALTARVEGAFCGKWSMSIHAGLFAISFGGHLRAGLSVFRDKWLATFVFIQFFFSVKVPACELSETSFACLTRLGASVDTVLQRVLPMHSTMRCSIPVTSDCKCHTWMREQSMRRPVLLPGPPRVLDKPEETSSAHAKRKPISCQQRKWQ